MSFVLSSFRYLFMYVCCIYLVRYFFLQFDRYFLFVFLHV